MTRYCPCCRSEDVDSCPCFFDTSRSTAGLYGTRVGSTVEVRTCTVHGCGPFVEVIETRTPDEVERDDRRLRHARSSPVAITGPRH